MAIVILNGEKENLEAELKIIELIKKNEFNPDVVTVSVNGEILRREEFETHPVKDGDTVDILMFMGGGR